MAHISRNFAALGFVVVVLTTVVGSGAFDVVTVDRTATINAAGDSNALLAITAHSSAPDVFGTGDSLSFELTQTSTTTHEGFLNVTNQGTQAVAVWVNDTDFTGGGSSELDGDLVGDKDEDNTGNITFFNRVYGGGAGGENACENGVPSIEGQANAVELAPGQTLEVGLQINASDVPGDEADLLDEMEVHANASVSGVATEINTAC